MLILYMYVSTREAQHPAKTYFNSRGNGIRSRKVERPKMRAISASFTDKPFAPKVLRSASPRILRSAGARTARRARRNEQFVA